MIIRVRSREGTFRLEVAPTETVAQVKQKILKTLAENKVADAKINQLRVERTSALLNDTATVKDCNLSQGELILLEFAGTVPETPSAPKTSTVKSTPSKSTPSYTPPKRKPKPKCSNHGPNGSCVACLSYDTVRVKRQEQSTCPGVSFDGEAANQFQAYVADLAFSVQRVGYLYGKIEEDGWVSVDVIYEPPQEVTATNYLALTNVSEEEMVNSLALLLGLQQVGIIIAHTNSDVILSSHEAMHAVELHKKCGSKHFVCVTVSANEEGSTQFEAYQLSDQFIELYDLEHFLPTEDPKIIKFKEKVFVGPKETTDVETDFFIVPVGIKQHQGNLSKGFPIENRQYLPDQAALKRYLQANKSLPVVQRIADFHLLLFVTQFLGTEYMEPLIEAVRTNKNIAATQVRMIDDLAGL